jgi:hypothetical protein
MMIFLFLVMLFTFVVFLGKYYRHFSISREGWRKITIAAVAAFIADYAIEKFIMRQREGNRRVSPDFRG